VVTLPERIGAADSGLIREQLTGLLHQGAAVLMVDMTRTLSCHRSGAAALLHVYQRALDGGAQLRVAVTAPAVRQVLEASGLDRLVPVYPSAEAAIAAGVPGVIPLLPRPGPGERPAGSRRRRAALDPRAGIRPGALWGLIDALADGVVLADEAGVLVLANRRAEDMFGWRPGELIGQPVESVVPAGARTEHVKQRAEYAREPVARPMGSRVRLAGQRRDGSTFPVRVSLSPVVTGTGRFIMAVIRDVTEDRPQTDLADLARAAAAAEDARRGRELLSQLVDDLFRVGLSLQTAAGLHHEAALEQIAGAVQILDGTIREIRDHVFAAPGQDGLPDLPP
jgi:anti-anti-sigma factor